MALTDAACRAAKGQEKLYKLSDAGGLQLWVHPTGSRTWRLAYRFEGKQKNLTLGTYPDMKLVEARDLRDDAKRRLRKGEDPAIVKEDVSSAPVRTFQEMYNEWFEKKKNRWSEGQSIRIASRMKRNVMADLGPLDITKIDADTILRVLRKIEDRDAVDMAKRVRQSVANVFQYCQGLGVIAVDPTVNMSKVMKTPPKKKRRSFVRPSGVPALMAAIRDYDGEPVTRLALEFTLRNMVRTKETRFAAWSEFEDLDGKTPLWRIPAERMKVGLEHLVPLSSQSVDLLREAKKFSLGTDFVFPTDSREGVMSYNTMLYALYRMGYHSTATVHGFRTTASTILNENGHFNSDWIERQLSHVEENQVRAAYNAAEYINQRREMLQWWSDYLDEKLEAEQSRRD
ncbi:MULTISPECIES: tyrosine-type recombinase/integrase [unclassified Agrobacterium]